MILYLVLSEVRFERDFVEDFAPIAIIG